MRRQKKKDRGITRKEQVGRKTRKEKDGRMAGEEKEGMMERKKRRSNEKKSESLVRTRDSGRMGVAERRMGGGNGLNQRF